MTNDDALLARGCKKPKFFYGYIIVLVALLTMVIVWGTYFSYGVFFKPVVTEFGWTRALTSGAYSLSLLLMGVLSIVMGRLNDRFGPRIISVVCGLLLGLGYSLMSQINTIWQLYLFFGVIVGIGLSGSFVPLLSTVARWFVKRRGLMTGIVASGEGVGMVIIPLLASRLVAGYGWRTAYAILGVITLVLLIVAAQFLRRDPSQIGQLPYGKSEVKQNGLVVEIKGFSLQEAIQTWQFWVLSAIFSFFGFAVMPITVHIVPHAIDLGISPILAVNILAILGGLTIIGTVAMGGIIDRIGNKLTLIIALVLLIISLVWIALAKELWLLYLSAALFGLGFGGVVAVESPIVADLFGLRAHGVIFGVVVFLVTIGGAVGPIVVGRLFDITGSYYLAFWLCAGVSLVSLILTLPLSHPHREGLAGDM